MCCDIVLLKKHCHKRLTSLDRFTFRGYHIAIFHIVSSRFLYSFDIIQIDYLASSLISHHTARFIIKLNSMLVQTAVCSDLMYSLFEGTKI